MEADKPVVMQELKGRITIYTVTGCLHCFRAKARLINMGLPYTEVNIKTNPEIRKYVMELTGRFTVPQIFFNGIFLGGNDDFENMPEEELTKLINMVKNEPVPDDAPPIPEPGAVKEEVPKEEPKIERDEYADLIVAFKESGNIGNHWSCLKVHHNTFTGKKLITWLISNRNVDKPAAVAMAKVLISRKFLNPLSENAMEDSDSLFRLVEHDSPSALNTGATAELRAVSASGHSEIMRELILKLFAEYITPDGKYVDYKGMATSPMFEEFRVLALQLQRLKFDNLDRRAKLAFFINTYNALVIHGNIVYNAPRTLWQRYKFFNTASYLIGGEIFSLHDIENGVLRANRKGIAQLSKPFAKGDPRLKAAVEEVEPMIHFGLNCGVQSCPPIKTYSAKEIDEQLKMATEAFLDGSDGCSIDVAKKEVRLSQLFKWYKVDFGGTDEKLLKWVFDHLRDSPKKTAMKELMAKGNVKITYLPYDWSTNAKD
ncbi:uncharacterized protein LOC116980420 isoform X2 [Amblyraja radiata]|uniref:uncharacterized protein LOC116980420 isoform X2 n=1 Tax=Amblyraja radiata TaxID=386614 RepID=UPI0014034806|nr:uncharacterized protein LOC116980420 isoform X2 [Amblyraja radiata]